ncbi:MAG: ABC-F type ribosomal protection protein [Clostridiales bacterium]|nr:ABC-F type ribosomal protection protein [Clostridiales bacterium]
MSIIKVENLTFSHLGSYDNVFENVSFTIDTEWKLGFVGRNGRGKTTFLNLLLGKYPYQGKIISSVQFDYFPYEVKDEGMLTLEVLEQICPTAQEWQFYKEFNSLEVDAAEVLHRPFGTLSKGEQTKALLIALFLNEGHFLLIDEPTNHLDLQARQVVSRYLQSKKGFVLVSHDRQFLDGCVDHVLSLNRANIEVQKGNFSSFMTNFENQQKFEQTQNARLQGEIENLRQAAVRTAGWSDRIEKTKKGVFDSGYVGHKSAKMMKRAKAIEYRQEKAIEQKSQLLKNTEVVESLKIHPINYWAETLVRLENVAVSFDGKVVCRDISFDIKRGERVALSGKNGCGKSSIIKLILQLFSPHVGKIHIGSGLKISYVSQDTSWLNGKLKDFASANGIDESLFLAILRKLDFSREQFDKDVKDFSAGQKKKVLIAKSLCEQAHLYIWDEPLNYIDVYSRMQIEQLLCEFKPTMLFVEHDGAFRDLIATKVIELK